MIPAIPTRYAGVTYRSRLEARWAVMFDALGWPFTYEPVDLERYIPDFVLTFPAGPVAVEVKPEHYLKDLEKHARHIAMAGWKGETLAVGAAMFAEQSWRWDAIIGALGERYEGEICVNSGCVFTCLDCGLDSLRSHEGSWTCRFNGCYGGNAHVGEYSPDQLKAIFAAAGNRVQWFPRHDPEAAE